LIDLSVTVQLHRRIPLLTFWHCCVRICANVCIFQPN